MVQTPVRVSPGSSRQAAMGDEGGVAEAPSRQSWGQPLGNRGRFGRRRFTIPLLVVAVLLMGSVAVGVGSGAVAQETTPGDLAGHPLAGTWAVMTAGGVVPQTHGADGSILAAYAPNYVDPVLGLTFQGPALGRWESTGARSGRFTIIQALSDAAGAYVGTAQLAADIEASEDGQTWADSGRGPHIVVRDVGNNVTFDEVVPLDSPVTATRVGATIESVVLPAATPMAATPAS